MYCYDSRKLHSLLCLRFGKVFIVSTQDLNSGYLFLSSFLNLRKIFIEILNSSIRLHLFLQLEHQIHGLRGVSWVNLSMGSGCQDDHFPQIFAKDSETRRLKRSAELSAILL